MKYRCECGNYIYKYVDVTQPIKFEYKVRWYLKSLLKKILQTL